MPPSDGGSVLAWILDAQLDWLALHASRAHSILELGAWKGRCTKVLAEATSGVVTVVDSWRGMTNPEDPVNLELRREGADAVFDQYMEQAGHLRNVTTYRMTSAEAWRRLGHACYDMVWIDGDHSYESVREDILMWGSLLLPGGLLCGHDGEYPEVVWALAELVPDAQAFESAQPAPLEDQPSIIWWSYVE